MLTDLPVKPKTIKDIQKQVLKDFDYVGEVATKKDILTYRGEKADAYVVKDLTPKQTKEMFGKTVQERANFLANHWDGIFKSWDKTNLTHIEGKKKGIESSLMEGSVKNPGAGFWKKTGKTVKFKGTGAKTGTDVQEKVPHSKKEGLAKFGIVDNRTAAEITGKTGDVNISGMNRNQKVTLLPAAMNRTGVAITRAVVGENLKTIPGVQGKNIITNLRNQLAGKNISQRIMEEIFYKKQYSYKDVMNEAKFNKIVDNLKGEFTNGDLMAYKERVHAARLHTEIITKKDLTRQQVEELLIVEERSREENFYGKKMEVIEANSMKNGYKLINEILTSRELGFKIEYEKPSTFVDSQKWRESDYKHSVKFLKS